MLIRYHLGEDKVWSVVRVPSVEVEDQRQLHRDLLTLKRERTQHNNRIKGLLASQGVRLAVGPKFLQELAEVALWDGSSLSPFLQARLLREYARWQYLQGQIKNLVRERQELLANSADPAIAKIRKLMQLRAVGIESAWLLVMEFFGWRNFRNGKEVGSLAGLTPTPHASGDSYRELGIDKAGNSWVRFIAIELAWSWLRWQPESELSRWFEARYTQGSKRTRKVGIVALARKLLVALWRYLETGAIPAGAQLKA